MTKLGFKRTQENKENVRLAQLRKPVIAELKCTRCFVRKAREEFPLRKEGFRGIKYQCIACYEEIAKKKELRRAEIELQRSIKKCTRCDIVKPVYEFCSSKTSLTRTKSWCKKCESEAAMGRYWENPQKASEDFRRLFLKRKYGISIKQFEDMLEEQNARCAICGTEEPAKGYKHRSNFSVDHDHDTGFVRGLLCSKCNRAMGLFCDSIDLLLAAAEYLKKANERQAKVDYHLGRRGRRLDDVA